MLDIPEDRRSIICGMRRIRFQTPAVQMHRAALAVSGTGYTRSYLQSREPHGRGTRIPRL